MKIITLWQPWAELVAAGAKTHETRSWTTKYRGRLAIHAAKRPLTSEGAELFKRVSVSLRVARDPSVRPFVRDPSHLQYGCVVSVVDLVDVYPADEVPESHSNPIDRVCGDFTAGRFAWRLVKLYRTHVPCKGYQGLRDIDPTLRVRHWGWNE